MDFTQRRTYLVLGLIAISSYLFFFAPLDKSLPEGSSIPAVTAELTDGELFDLQAHRGDVVVLAFWASWCGPCRREAPVLNALHAQGIAIFGLGVDDKPAAQLQREANELGIRYPVGRPSAGVLERLKVSVVPTIYVVDPKGTIVLARTGEVSEQVLTAAIHNAQGG